MFGMSTHIGTQVRDCDVWDVKARWHTGDCGVCDGWSYTMQYAACVTHHMLFHFTQTSDRIHCPSCQSTMCRNSGGGTLTLGWAEDIAFQYGCECGYGYGGGYGCCRSFGHSLLCFDLGWTALVKSESGLGCGCGCGCGLTMIGDLEGLLLLDGAPLLTRGVQGWSRFVSAWPCPVKPFLLPNKKKGMFSRAETFTPL
jgi:hypothetical protein